MRPMLAAFAGTRVKSYLFLKKKHCNFAVLDERNSNLQGLCSLGEIQTARQDLALHTRKIERHGLTCWCTWYRWVGLCVGVLTRYRWLGESSFVRFLRSAHSWSFRLVSISVCHPCSFLWAAWCMRNVQWCVHFSRFQDVQDRQRRWWWMLIPSKFTYHPKQHSSRTSSKRPVPSSENRDTPSQNQKHNPLKVHFIPFENTTHLLCFAPVCVRFVRTVV